LDLARRTARKSRKYHYFTVHYGLRLAHGSQEGLVISAALVCNLLRDAHVVFQPVELVHTPELSLAAAREQTDKLVVIPAKVMLV
jgi:hypothetical protein